MKGVRPGLLVAWGPTGAEARLGIVLDRAPGPAMWWVLPEGLKVAEQLASRDLRSAPNRPRPVAPWDPTRDPRRRDESEPALSTAEPGEDDVPLVDLTPYENREVS